MQPPPSPSLGLTPYANLASKEAGKPLAEKGEVIAVPFREGGETGAMDGAQGRNRTTDTVIFSHVLYQLSYLGPLLRAALAKDGSRSEGVPNLRPLRCPPCQGDPAHRPEDRRF